MFKMFERSHKCPESRYRNRNLLKILGIILLGLTLILGRGVLKASAGSISGTIIEDCASPPCDSITATIQVDVFAGSPSGSIYWIESVSTDTGNYTIADLEPGDYWLKTNNMNQSDYVNEWWASGGSTYDFNGAEAATVSAVGTTTANFQLDTGVSIAGTIYKSDGATEVTDALIVVSALLGDPCGIYQWLGDAHNIPPLGGHYQMRGVPIGTEIILRAYNVDQSDYVNEWWASGGTTYDCWEAEAFPVSTTPVPPKDFQLELGGSISGTVVGNGGTPLEGVWVQLSLTRCGWMLGGIGNHSDANGDYHIRGVPTSTGSAYVQTCALCRGLNYIDEWWNGVLDCDQATQVNVDVGVETPDIDFALEQAAIISGSVVDSITSEPVEDASCGSINLSPGWHKFVYRHQEAEGGQLARAEFKEPGEEWRVVSTANLDLRTSINGDSGISLETKRLTCYDGMSRNHQLMELCVDVEATAESGWSGQSTVTAVDHYGNIHGNDDYYTSYYEAYFEVTSAGEYSFCTDSDDASEIVIDDQVVAYWYNFHGSAGRREHKFDVNLIDYDTRAWLNMTSGNPDGTYEFMGVLPGDYIVTAIAPGYAEEFYNEAVRFEDATVVSVGAGDTEDADFTLFKGPHVEFYHVQRRTYEDSRLFNRLGFGLADEAGNYPTEDILDTVTLKRKENGTEVDVPISIDPPSNPGFFPYKELGGRYSGGQWQYRGGFIDRTYYGFQIDAALVPGTYHLIATDDGRIYEDYWTFSSLEDLPVISNESFNILKDGDGNLTWEWQIPAGAEHLSTSCSPFIKVYSGGEYFGEVYVSVPTSLGHLFLPAQVLQLVESEGDRFEFCMQFRTNDNNNRTYSNCTEVFSFNDSDGDQRLDDLDDFPLDPNEWLDTDGDGTGNNADTDDDNDGVPDGSDAFPLDASEWLDTDGDGVGNNTDNCPGTPNPTQADSDLDGIGDACDFAQDNPYVDFHVGDTLLYDVLFNYDIGWPSLHMTDRLVATGTININGNVYFHFETTKTFDDGTVWEGDIYFREDDNGNVWYSRDGSEEVFYLVNPLNHDIGYEWSVPSWELGGEGTVDRFTIQSRTDTVTVPAGTFTNCLRLYEERISLSDSTILYAGPRWLAEGIGTIKRDNYLFKAKLVNDQDEDGIPDGRDNCPTASNPSQEDTDVDGYGDACDPCPADPHNDADGDGFCANVDNCPTISNPYQEDADIDDYGDACDPCPDDPDNDADGDGVCDHNDNCPGPGLDNVNPDQADFDGDGIGDVCDPFPSGEQDPDDEPELDAVAGDSPEGVKYLITTVTLKPVDLNNDGELDDTNYVIPDPYNVIFTLKDSTGKVLNPDQILCGEPCSLPGSLDLVTVAEGSKDYLVKIPLSEWHTNLPPDDYTVDVSYVNFCKDLRPLQAVPDYEPEDLIPDIWIGEAENPAPVSVPVGEQVGDQCPGDELPFGQGAGGTGCPVAGLYEVMLYTVNIGKRTPTKEVLPGVSVYVYDREKLASETVFGSNPKGSDYPAIVQSVTTAAEGFAGACITDINNGECYVGMEATGDYLGIAAYFDQATGYTVYVGRPMGPSDFVAGIAEKQMQVIKTVKRDGTVVFRGGSKTYYVGSLLEVISPESGIWEGTHTVYPFIFTSDSNWTVNVCVKVPGGYSIVGVYNEDGDLIPSANCLQTFVSGETKVVTFEVQGAGSRKPRLDAKLQIVSPKGKKVTKKVKVDDIRKKTLKARVRKLKDRKKK